MILEDHKVKEIILKRPNGALILRGQKYSRELRKHFYGNYKDGLFDIIKGYESENQKELRAKYAKSNKDLMVRLTRPMDKVFSARGGSIYYNVPESKERLARSIAQDVKGGVSIKKWIETMWRAHYLDDPYGLIFMELPSSEAEGMRRANAWKSIAYPTYKDINVIYDYLPNESGIEYVVISVNTTELALLGIKAAEGETYYRVVDDSQDRYYKRKGEEVTEITELRLGNFFMKVPAITMSDIPDPECPMGKLSLVDAAIETANEFLLTGSIKVSHKFMHGFPKYWEYADDCHECKGHGEVNGETCPRCKGLKKQMLIDYSQAKMLPYPEKDDQVVTPQVAGYVSPDKTYYEIATHDLQTLENYMAYTVWGTSQVQQTHGMSMDDKGDATTATQIMNEIKPQADRLTTISQCGESRHKFVLDCALLVQVDQNHKGSSVNYGNRFMLEGPDELWLKYSEARKSGASEAILDSLLIEYYEANYFNDPVELAIKIKLIQVEPNVHKTAAEIKNLGYDPEYLKQKMYFGDWKRSLTQAQLIAASVDSLKQDLTTYCKGKALLPPADPKNALPASK